MHRGSALNRSERPVALSTATYSNSESSEKPFVDEHHQMIFGSYDSTTNTASTTNPRMNPKAKGKIPEDIDVDAIKSTF